MVKNYKYMEVSDQVCRVKSDSINSFLCENCTKEKYPDGNCKKKEATKFLIEYGFTDSFLCLIWEHQGKIEEQTCTTCIIVLFILIYR